MPYNRDLERRASIAGLETDALIEAPEQVLRELSPAARIRIRAGLLEIDAHWYRDDKSISNWSDYYWRAYDVFAAEILADQVTTDDLLENILPALASDAVIDNGWCRCLRGQATASEICSKRFGKYWFHPNGIAMIKQILAPSMSQWRAAGLRRSLQPDAAFPKTKTRGGRRKLIPFDTPAGATWQEVSIGFLDGHTASIKIRDQSCVCTFSEMGMVNRKNGNPTLQWKLLQSFATGRGLLDWKHSQADWKNKKRRQQLAKDLQAFFQIFGDPFKSTPDRKGWSAIFTILPER